MFLSLDIVGSTEFKQTARDTDQVGGADSWVAPFLSFYRISVEQMAIQWERVVRDIKAVERPGEKRFEFGECPSFWKGAGDEVLFSKIVRSPFDALAAIHALLEVMKEHRKQFGPKPQTRRLNVKGAAWLAGFPINNAEIILPTRGPPSATGVDDPVAENYRLLNLHKGSATGVYLADYIGPSVDLGFRLRDHATPRRLVVSADLAWLLCYAHRNSNEGEQTKSQYLRIPHVGYDGRHGLRGILGGEPYPLVWIESDIGNSLDEAEDRLLGREHLSTKKSHEYVSSLWDFAEVFLTDQGPLRMRPYIPGCADPTIANVDANHQRRLKEIEALVNGPAGQLASLRQADKGHAEIPQKTQDFAYVVVNDFDNALPKKKLETRDAGRKKKKV